MGRALRCRSTLVHARDHEGPETHRAWVSSPPRQHRGQGHPSGLCTLAHQSPAPPLRAAGGRRALELHSSDWGELLPLAGPTLNSPLG